MEVSINGLVSHLTDALCNGKSITNIRGCFDMMTGGPPILGTPGNFARLSAMLLNNHPNMIISNKRSGSVLGLLLNNHCGLIIPFDIHDDFTSWKVTI